MTTAEPSTTPKPRRRWLQFSLRTLMVLMLVLGCGLAWFAREVEQLVELNLDNTQVSDAGLTHLQGLTQLEYLHLDSTQVSGAGLVHLQGLTQLRELYLDDTQVSDVG